MRNFSRQSLWIAALLPLAACSRDAITNAPTPIKAQVRFVNAVADTVPLDIRFVDDIFIEQPVMSIGLRGVQEYRAVEPGNRTLRFFYSSPNISLAQIQVLPEIACNFAANRKYTVILSGRARLTSGPEAARAECIEDTPPASVASNRVAVRFLHAAVGVGNVDVRLDPSTTNPLPAFSPTAGNANVAFRAFTNRPYTDLAAQTAPNTYTVRVAATGTTTALITTNAPAGAVGSTTVNPAAGLGVGGSAITAVAVPAATAGSPAASAATNSAGVVFLLADVRPPNTVN